MSEDLGFHGNELVKFQMIFTVGNVLGLLPFAYLFPKVPMHWLVPSLDLGWGIFTLLQYRAQSYGEIIAYRFMVSIFEVPFLAPNLKTRANKKGVLFPWRPLCPWFLVQERRNRSTRRCLLHWSYAWYSHSRAAASRSVCSS